MDAEERRILIEAAGYIRACAMFNSPEAERLTAALHRIADPDAYRPLRAGELAALADRVLPGRSDARGRRRQAGAGRPNRGQSRPAGAAAFFGVGGEPVDLADLERRLADQGGGPTSEPAALVRRPGRRSSSAGASGADAPAAVMRLLARIVLAAAQPTRAVVCGATIWTLETRPVREQFVCCYGVESEGSVWVARRTEERDGPEVVTCPLALLAAVSETHSRWRRSVRAFHEAEVPAYEVLI